MARDQSYPAAASLSYVTLETPAGPVSVGTDGRFVRSILLDRRAESGGPPNSLDREASRQLEEYFAGRRHRFDLPVRLAASTFTASVLQVVRRIGYGETLSYGDVAGAVGQPRAARAVGQAVGANPLPLVIPCHRVLAAHSAIGGFGSGLAWKRFLLELEGITWREASRA